MACVLRGTVDTVEVNATFYRLPRRSTVARWADTTPEDFCFAVKGSRYLTHVRRLNDLAGESWVAQFDVPSLALAQAEPDRQLSV